MELELVSYILADQMSKLSGKSGYDTTGLLSLGSSGSFGGGSTSEFSLLMSALMLQSNLAQRYSSSANSDSTAINALQSYADSTLTTATYELTESATNEQGRSPATINAIIRSLDVENNPKYTPYKNGYTYCNIYAQDVMAALGTPLPNLLAANTDTWLRSSDGYAAGWRETDAATAQRFANAGCPAVTTMGSEGHLQVVVPERDGAYNPARGVAVSQAGSHNYEYTHQVEIPQLKYFVHL